MPIIKLNLLDFFYYRDGEPVKELKNIQPENLLTPYPSVVYNALKRELKAPEKNDFVEIKNYYLQLDGETVFPLPGDCCLSEANRSPCAFVAGIAEKDFSSNYKLPFFLDFLPERFKNHSGYFIGSKNFSKYLKLGSETGIVNCKQRQIFEITRGGRKAPRGSRSSGKDGNINQIDYELRLIIKYSGDRLPNKGVFRIGQTGKAVRFEHVSEPVFFQEPGISFSKQGLLKVYLATPAIFKKGWFPQWLDEKQNFTGVYKGVKFKMIAAVPGEPRFVDGPRYDSEKPRSMYKAVPAGSVYYFEYEGNLQQVLTAMKKEKLSEYRAEEGFGICYPGVVRPHN